MQNGQALLSYDRFINAAAQNFRLEISDDSVNWRTGESSVISETVAPVDALSERVTIGVRRTSNLQFFRITYIAP